MKPIKARFITIRPKELSGGTEKLRVEIYGCEGKVGQSLQLLGNLEYQDTNRVDATKKLGLNTHRIYCTWNVQN